MKNRNRIKFLSLFLFLPFLFLSFSLTVRADDTTDKAKSQSMNDLYKAPAPKFQETAEDREKLKKEEKEKKEEKQDNIDKELAKEISPKKIVKQGGQTLKGEEYPLDNYIGVSTDQALNPTDKAMVGISNGIYSITKLIYSGIDMSLNTLSSKEIIKEQSPKIEKVSKSMWDNLSNVFAITFIALAALVALYVLSIKSDFTTAILTIFKTALVFCIAGVWFAKASVFMTAFDNSSNQIQTSILSAGTSLLTTENEVPQGQETEATTAVLRNSLFNTTVYRPYLLMNWGTVNVSEIEKKYGEIDRLTEIKKGNKGQTQVNDIVGTQVNEKGNSYMDWQGSGIYNKLGVAIISLFVVLLFGIPLLLISLSNLLIQFMILALGLVLPVAFLISLIPKYSNGAYTVFEKLLFLFLSKAFISLFLLLILFVVVITDNVVPLNNAGSYMLNSALLIVVLNMLLVKRQEIISLITAGKVNVSDGGATRGIKGAGFGALLTAGGMSKVGKKAKRAVTSPVRGVGAINRGVRGTQNTLNTLSSLRNFKGKGSKSKEQANNGSYRQNNAQRSQDKEFANTRTANQGQGQNTTRPNPLSKQRDLNANKKQQGSSSIRPKNVEKAPPLSKQRDLKSRPQKQKVPEKEQQALSKQRNLSTQTQKPKVSKPRAVQKRPVQKPLKPESKTRPKE